VIGVAFVSVTEAYCLTNVPVLQTDILGGPIGSRAGADPCQGHGIPEAFLNDPCLFDVSHDNEQVPRGEAVEHEVPPQSPLLLVCPDSGRGLPKLKQTLIILRNIPEIVFVTIDDARYA
jgi:hypothetical protein